MTDKTSFTPGPWTVKEKTYQIADTGDYDRYYYVSPADSEYPTSIVEIFPKGDVDDANAHLIAAAPDLYSAALSAEESIAGFIGTYGDNGAGLVLDELRAAIKKARGDGE